MSIMFLNYLENIALALIVPESKLFALLEGQAEFFQIFAQPVGVISRIALPAGYGKKFFARLGTAFAAAAHFHNSGKLAKIKFIKFILIIFAEKSAQ